MIELACPNLHLLQWKFKSRKKRRQFSVSSFWTVYTLFIWQKPVKITFCLLAARGRDLRSLWSRRAFLEDAKTPFSNPTDKFSETHWRISPEVAQTLKLLSKIALSIFLIINWSWTLKKVRRLLVRLCHSFIAKNLHFGAFPLRTEKVDSGLILKF